MNTMGYPLEFLDVVLKDQVFELIDIPILLVVLLVEVLFSADNMLVLGILIKKLPKIHRSLAIWLGIIGSIILRVIAILLASYLIRFYYFQGIGGLYLIYIAFYELFSKKNPFEEPALHMSLWKTVLSILLLDLVFSIDSILAAFAVVGISPLDGDTSPKLWIVVVGASAGILLLRSFTVQVIRLLEKKPILENYTLIFVAWIGLRLFIEACLSSLQIDFGISVLEIRELVKWIFWSITLLFFIYAFFEIFRNKKNRKTIQG
ncbi:hypothetical protein EB008_02275 [bacterium]|nr:hypothetical protein [bacterium]